MRAWKPAVMAVTLALAGSGCATIVRSSVASNGTPADAISTIGPRFISDNGRYVVFRSAAANLVPDDTNGAPDVFRHDNVTGTTVRVSVGNGGAQIPGGQVIETMAHAISGDGQHVVFQTEAALEPEDRNFATDVYVRSVAAGTTERVSIRPDGTPILRGNVAGLEAIGGTTISDDGRFVLVTDSRPESGSAYLRDRVAHTTTVLADLAGSAVLSGDGTHMVENHLCVAGPCPFRSTVVSIAGDPREEIDTACGFLALDVSADARFVVGRRFGVYPRFTCPEPTGLVRWDRTTKRFRKVPVTSFNESGVSIANSGRFVSVLTGGGSVEVADLVTGATQLVDSDTTGQAGSGHASGAAISGSGRYVGFASESQLVPEDTDAIGAVFTRFSVRPGVTAVAPSSLRRATLHQLVTLTGTEFLLGATVSISGPGITVHSATVVSSTAMRVDISVDPGAPVGSRDVIVSNRGGFGHSDGWCPGCLTIT